MQSVRLWIHNHRQQLKIDVFFWLWLRTTFGALHFSIAQLRNRRIPLQSECMGQTRPLRRNDWLYSKKVEFLFTRLENDFDGI